MSRVFAVRTDQRGRMTLPMELRSAMGLLGKGRVEWFETESGEIAFRAKVEK